MVVDWFLALSSLLSSQLDVGGHTFGACSRQESRPLPGIHFLRETHPSALHVDLTVMPFVIYNF